MKLLPRQPLRRRSCRLRRHVASWLSTRGLPGRPSVVAPGLDGVRQATGSGAGDAGRDGAAQGPDDARLRCSRRSSGSRRSSDSTSRWPRCGANRCSPRPRELQGRPPPPPPPTTSRSTGRDRRAEHLHCRAPGRLLPAMSDLPLYCCDPSTLTSPAPGQPPQRLSRGGLGSASKRKGREGRRRNVAADPYFSI